MKKVLLGILVCLLLITGCSKKNIIGNGKDKEKPVEKKLQIVDLDSKSRSIGVMVNNHKIARANHTGLDDAYLIYEMVVEGGMTRLFALYKDKNTEKIGSVRSARHYFLDYALENDAIYVHFGWSPKSQTDIQTLNIANINGLYDSPFWRDKTLGVATEHTAFTKMSDLKDVAVKKNYRMTSDNGLVFDYSIDNINVSEFENSIPASNVVIPYSTNTITSYTYDSLNANYKRFVNNVEHSDDITKKQYTVKNIVIVKAKNYTIDNSGRQELVNVGSGNGYYITNGYAVPITWEKSNRSSKTVYKYLDGTKIKLNDGNTYVQIHPINEEITIN